jgi:hypothetical protein
MRNASVLIFVILALFGCASTSKGLVGSLATIKVADEVKAADTINGKASATINAGTQSTTTSTRTGRDMNVTNDSAVMEKYIDAIRDGARQQVKLYRYIIGALMAQMALLIGLVGWAMKRAMMSNESDDKFKEKLLEKRR